MGILLLLLMVMLLYLVLMKSSTRNIWLLVAKLLAGAALRPRPHPLPGNVVVADVTPPSAPTPSSSHYER